MRRSTLEFELLVRCALAFLVGPAVLYSQQSSGTIAGTVRDTSGTAVTGAEVTLKSPERHAITGGSGEFLLSGIPAGQLELRVRRLGFSPDSTAVNVQLGVVTRLALQMTPLPIRLATVQVLRRAEPYDSRLAGFNARLERRVGHFVTREQLDRMSSARFVDAVRNIPGLQLRSLRGGGTTVFLRGSHCPALVFIDGFPADAGTMDLDMIDLSGVEGIEVYSGSATIPSEFMAARETQGCGVVAIWSRPTKARRHRIGGLGEVDIEKLLAAQAVYTADQVDDPARLDQGTAVPIYPDSLWRAGISGRVVAEFIVDSEGSIEAGSVRIVSATDPYFIQPVTAALGGATFHAALLKGNAVRQIVQLPFLFVPGTPDSDAPPPR
ncbi:MAG: carboxypeptidase regulatory-like domain-containing protein [Gemmatimonadaceae bacterium]